MSLDIIHTFKNKLSCRPYSSDSILATILAGLLKRYFERVSDAGKCFKLMHERGDNIINDHIAFRSLDCSNLIKLFLHFDYTLQFDTQEAYPFNFTAPDKPLTAVWLKHPNPDMPRIFISEIRLEDLPKTPLDIAPHIRPYLAQLKDPFNTLNLEDPDAVVSYLHTSLWPTPRYTDYKAVNEVSEYLAWVLYNEYYLNHFTLTINDLNSFGYQHKIQTVINTFKKKATQKDNYLEALKLCYKNIMLDFNSYLESQGFILNNSGNKKLNISPDGLLLQSSTQANLIEAKFSDSTHTIPGSYVEFAYRGILPETALSLLEGNLQVTDLDDGHLRDGFEIQNAAHIFDSTSLKKQGKESDHDLSAPKKYSNAYLKSRKKILALQY